VKIAEGYASAGIHILKFGKILVNVSVFAAPYPIPVPMGEKYGMEQWTMTNYTPYVQDVAPAWRKNLKIAH